MAKALFARVDKRLDPFFLADAVVRYAKGTVKKHPPAVLFVVEAQDGLNTCQAGVCFNLFDRKDKTLLDLISQLLGAD